jgi:hypothetical protein
MKIFLGASKLLCDFFHQLSDILCPPVQCLRQEGNTENLYPPKDARRNIPILLI